MKKCTTCKNFKDVSNFSVDNSRGDGLHASCKECCSARRNAHYQKNKQKASLQNKQWKYANKEKNRSNERNRENVRRAVDPIFKLKKNLRSRLYSAIKKLTKTGSAVDELGCTGEELKVYLESKFQPGMTWENYSHKGWHVDHVLPLDSFDLSDPKQLAQACHYTNLQPLWAKDNLLKSNRVA